MLNITLIRGNNQYAAAHYFSSADDYYAKENPGQWQGRGAELLGLSGPIEQAELSRLLNGQLPNNQAIQATFDPKDNKKRMGLDLTFSAPKSVSMQALIGGDKDVTTAHDRAVMHALKEVERLAQTRKKIKGKSHRERTGNMVIGKFRHEMSRAKDPQLHTHGVVLNMTRRSDGAWRALANEDVFRVHHEVDAIYKAELAKELQALGYSIRIVDHHGNFELDHIARDQIEAFSARGMVIEEALASQGKTRETATALEKQVISLATRPRKDESDREVIKQYWVEKSTALQINYGMRGVGAGYVYSNGQKPAEKMTLPEGLSPAQAVVEYAINHLTERECVVRETDILAAALQRAVGLAGSDDIKAEIKRLVAQGTLIPSAPSYHMAEQRDGPSLSPMGWKQYLSDLKGWTDRQAKQYVARAIKQGALVEVEKRYTTQKALKREKVILAIERDGRGQVQPILSKAALDTAFEVSALNDGQRCAVEAILCTNNRFVGVQGDAGTGKTYAVNVAVELIRDASRLVNDLRVLVLAPYGNQVKALKQEGLDAHTLASFLRTKYKPIDDNTIIILDESGVVGARQMEQAMRIVETTGARMVLLGDTKQTEAIEAGRPFAQLQEAGMKTARIHEIQRQKEPQLKQSVEYAARGQVVDSLKHISHIQEIPVSSVRHRAIVNDYISLTPIERDRTLIITGTNQARKEINAMVRESLFLKGQGKKFDTLSRVDLTQAQRRFAPSYQQGMVIQPDKDYVKAGLIRGETYRVNEAVPGNLLILDGPDGSVRTINPRTVTQLSVYQLERTELSIGDQIRINRNNPSLDLTSGDRMRVASIERGLVRLEVDGKTGHKAIELLASKPLHLEHAYSSTVHSTQGLTNDRALMSIDTKSRTTSMNLYYVAISRAKYEARIYTNSLQSLPKSISRRFEKTTALNIQRERFNDSANAKQALQGAAGGRPGIKREGPTNGKSEGLER